MTVPYSEVDNDRARLDLIFTLHQNFLAWLGPAPRTSGGGRSGMNLGMYTSNKVSRIADGPSITVGERQNYRKDQCM